MPRSGLFWNSPFENQCFDNQDSPLLRVPCRSKMSPSKVTVFVQLWAKQIFHGLSLLHSPGAELCGILLSNLGEEGEKAQEEKQRQEQQWKRWRDWWSKYCLSTMTIWDLQNEIGMHFERWQPGVKVLLVVKRPICSIHSTVVECGSGWIQLTPSRHY